MIHTRTADGRPGLGRLDLTAIAVGEVNTSTLPLSKDGVDTRIGNFTASLCDQAGAPSPSYLGQGPSPPTKRLLHHAELPPWALHLTPGANGWSGSTAYRFSCASPIHPAVNFEFDLCTGEVIQQPSSHRAAATVPPRDSISAECRRISFPSYDGTLVPLTLVSPLPDEEHPKLVPDEKHPKLANTPKLVVPSTEFPSGSSLSALPPPPRPSPILLLAYGAYGSVMDMSHDPFLIRTFLDRGWRVSAWRVN